MTPNVHQKTLYKADKKAGTRVWWVEIRGDEIRTVAGLLDGEKVESGWKKMKAKNVGRANATTPEEQAVLEAYALYEKKLAQGGYNEQIEDATATKYIKPMLAEPYKDSLPLNFAAGIYSQPKLDGMRCIATKNGLFTRKGKNWVSVPHIQFALYDIFEMYPDLILDGELYNHAFHDDFNEISSVLRKSKNLTEEVLDKSARIAQYHVYDIVDLSAKFSERYAFLRQLFTDFPQNEIKVVPSTLVESEDDLERIYGEYLAENYEGQILRYDIPYMLDKRHKHVMVKRKEFFDEEFEILDIQEGEGNWAGCAKRLLYKLKTGDGKVPGTDEYPAAGIKGSKEYCAKLLVNKHLYIGGDVTVRFPNKTPAGVPRFPIATAIFRGRREI